VRRFFDDQDRKTYLELLVKYSKSFAMQNWAYCLMPKHVHLLAVPEKRELSCLRDWLDQSGFYTQYLNRKLKQSGRMWQNRFFSYIIEREEYLWTVARYIESNPVKADMVKQAEDYRWSSARAYLTSVSDTLLYQPSWL
jgi:putative transposase